MNLCLLMKIIAVGCFVPASSFSNPSAPALSRYLYTTRLAATADDVNGESRRKLLGLALPVAVALIGQSPLLAVIAKPPSAEQREEMLTEWCKGEYCTLLGGGAGYFSDSGGTYNPSLEMPSSEEFEEKARRAAEVTED